MSVPQALVSRSNIQSFFNKKDDFGRKTSKETFKENTRFTNPLIHINIIEYENLKDEFYVFSDYLLLYSYSLYLSYITYKTYENMFYLYKVSII